MGRKRKAAGILGVSVVTLLLIYQLLVAAGDFASTVLNWNIPIEYYGWASLFFIAVALYMLLTGRKEV